MFWLGFPFIRYSFFLILGILLAYFNSSIFIVFTISFLSFAVLYFTKMLKSGWLVFFVVLGYFLHVFNNQRSLISEGEYFVKCKVVSWANESEKWSKVEVKLLAISENAQNWKFSNEKCLFFIEKNKANIFYGDELYLKVKLQLPSKPLNPGQMDYSKYLQNHHIQYIAYISNTFTILKGAHKDVFYYSYLIRKFFENQFKKYIHGKQEYAILVAMILGIRSVLDQDLFAAYSNSGIIHVIAISGLHIALFFELLSKLLFFLPNFRKHIIIKSIITLLLIWTYSFVVGLGASVIRATLMYTILLIAKIFNKDRNFLNALGISAFLILFFDTNYLFDIGFQLSFLALIGILYIQPIFISMYAPKNWLLEKIWNITVMTISAQVATLCITWYYFNKININFLIANLIVIPLSELVLYISVVFAGFSTNQFIGKYVGILLEKLVWSMNQIAAFNSKIPYSSFERIGLSEINFLLLIFSILFIFTYIKLKNKYLYLSSLVCLSLVFLYQSYLFINSAFQKHLIVHAAGKYRLFTYKNGLQTIQFAEDSIHFSKNKIKFLTDRYLAQNFISHNKIVYLSSEKPLKQLKIENKQILIVNKWKNQYSNLALKSDLIICKSRILKQIPESLKHKIIIEGFAKQNITAVKHVLEKEGAYILNL